MSFNRNAIKRFSMIAGVDRSSKEVINILGQEVDDHLTAIVARLITRVNYRKNKTVNVSDLKFISQQMPELVPLFVCPNDLSKIVKVCVDQKSLIQVLKHRRGYCVYTQKKPFRELVKKIFLEQDEATTYRLGKNVVILLQLLTEQHLINLIYQAGTYMRADHRETLLPKDIDQVR